MSRVQQDQFIDDDEDETCPLCVEEFDLSDKNFRPCQCGYQICQFCYNNIKTTMNSQCPACRRPYDDKTIEWKTFSQEEIAAHKAQIAQRAKKNAAIRQKEAQKREADHLSRKHLAGLRVVQKNLVYVTGLSPTVQEDKLLQTLRGPQYFGQYGKIIKIVVSKSKDASHPQQSVGVYVTFERKEDAASCIAAVDGSSNGDRVLRAQFGTTKYCSAYLRNETCNNRNCMFLHEPGEENESFTRQDLSSMNVISTQQPAQSSTGSTSAPVPQPPPQSQQPVASATQPSGIRESMPLIPGDPADAPGLPSTASWASKVPQSQPSRRGSPVMNESGGSPTPTPAVPAALATEQATPVLELAEPADGVPKTGPEPQPTADRTSGTSETPSVVKRPRRTKSPDVWKRMIKTLASYDLSFTFDESRFSAAELQLIQNYPSLIDPRGGAKLRARRNRETEERRRLEAERRPTLQTELSADADENLEMSGSLQLGGEPEDRQDLTTAQLQQHAIQPPSHHDLGGRPGIDLNYALDADVSSLSLHAGMLPQQQQQPLQQFKNTPQSSNAFQSQQPVNPPGHARNVSRYTFANDSSTASASVKPVASAKLMNQQSSMMPPGNNNHLNTALQHQGFGNQFYTSTVQGPPPGLKTVGTPPVSGGGMFGQGHGFATSGLGYGANVAGRGNNNEDRMRDLLRSRGPNVGSGQVPDGLKREYSFPSFLHQHQSSSSSVPSLAPGLSYTYGSQSGAFHQDAGPKPKKKGKKHRHANTSSSGGGVVDVADPSILQARLHQSQGGGAGQGLFAGQGQDGVDRAPLEEASRGVDALVGDSRPASSRPVHSHHPLEETRRSTPEIPPGLEGLGQAVPSAAHLHHESRRATPSIPPGFSAPSAVPLLNGEALSRPGSRPSSRASAKRITSAVVVPAPQVASIKTTTLSKEATERAVLEDTVQTPTKAGADKSSKADESAKPVDARAVESKQATPGEPKAEPTYSKPVLLVRAVANVQIDSSREHAQPPSDGKGANSEQDAPASRGRPAISSDKARDDAHIESGPLTGVESIPTLVKLGQKPPQSAESLVKVPANVPDTSMHNESEFPSLKEASNKAETSKRKHPGKLDITAAISKKEDPHTVSASATSLKNEMLGKNLRATSLTPSSISRPASPGAATDSPAKRTGPRTLRVVQTPKAEIPPLLPLNAPPLPTHSVVKLQSRRHSIASINPPETPSSEHLSDNVSLTSTSVSRASSPPPPGSKIGSAPVRTKTKSQLKKERQERAKTIEEEQSRVDDPVETPIEGPVQEAITGRKKKTKKSAAAGGTLATAPKVAEATTAEEPKPTASAKEEPQKLVRQQKTESAHQPTVAKTPPPAAVHVPRPRSPKPTPKPHEFSPATLIADLRATSTVLAACLENFLKPVNQHGAQTRLQQPITAADLAALQATMSLDPLASLSDDQTRQLLDGTGGVKYGGEDGRLWSRGLITPEGKHLRALSEELEARFVELEKRAKELDDACKFHAAANGTGVSITFPTLDLERELEIRRAEASVGGLSANNRGGRQSKKAREMAEEEVARRGLGPAMLDEVARFVNGFVMPTYPTPPVSAGAAASQAIPTGRTQDGQAVAGAVAGGTGVGVGTSVDVMVRLLDEAKRVAEEKEGALRRVVKRNRKLVGMSPH
ncbi:transcriptional repressor general negative regulator of transcription subunit 4 [Elasticomyces elasticus]|nr:transcriptional repressor general negative regulator of transcription subunit 4 [Elasticomyces elasticus]